MSIHIEARKRRVSTIVRAFFKRRVYDEEGSYRSGAPRGLFALSGSTLRAAEMTLSGKVGDAMYGVKHMMAG